MTLLENKFFYSHNNLIFSPVLTDCNHLCNKAFALFLNTVTYQRLFKNGVFKSVQ